MLLGMYFPGAVITHLFSSACTLMGFDWGNGWLLLLLVYRLVGMCPCAHRVARVCVCGCVRVRACL